VVTGDGYSLSIGGNHLIHMLRRNVDLKVLMFNNQIYGLTKGQYSPTSEVGKRTKSTPMGSLDHPFKPLSVVLGAEGTFVARTIDREPKHMAEMLRRAHAHKGTAFVEIYQNCNIFNDGAFGSLTDRKAKHMTQLHLKNGEPLLFGKDKEKGIMFDGFEPKVVDVAEVGIEAIHVHDESGPLAYHHLLAQMSGAGLPTPIGVLRSVERPAYDEMVNAQVESAVEQRGRGSLKKLLYGGDTWQVS